MTNPEDTGAGERVRPSALTISKVQDGMRRYHRENPGNNCHITLAAEWCIAAEIDAPSATAVAREPNHLRLVLEAIGESWNDWWEEPVEDIVDYIKCNCMTSTMRDEMMDEIARLKAAPSGAAGVGVSEDEFALALAAFRVERTEAHMEGWKIAKCEAQLYRIGIERGLRAALVAFCAGRNGG